VQMKEKQTTPLILLQPLLGMLQTKLYNFKTMEHPVGKSTDLI